MNYSECLHITCVSCQQQFKLSLLDQEGLDRYRLAGCGCGEGEWLDEVSGNCVDKTECSCVFGDEVVGEGEVCTSGCLAWQACVLFATNDNGKELCLLVYVSFLLFFSIQNQVPQILIRMI